MDFNARGRESFHEPALVKRRPSPTVDITEGAIRVSSRGRVLTLMAAAPPPDAEDRTDFLIHLDDIAFWDAPHDAEEVDIDELQRILDAIEAECDKHGLSIAFE